MNNSFKTKRHNWAGLDSNQRSITQRIYNPSPLTTRTPTPLILINDSILRIKKQYLKYFNIFKILTLIYL